MRAVLVTSLKRTQLQLSSEWSKFSARLLDDRIIVRYPSFLSLLNRNGTGLKPGFFRERKLIIFLQLRHYIIMHGADCNRGGLESALLRSNPFGN